MTAKIARQDRNVFEDPGHAGHYPNLIPMMSNWLRLDRLPGRTVIDLGCGYGWWGEALLQHGADVRFFDAREENLAAVRARHPNVATHVMNVETDAFPQDKADLILCMGLIYHLADPASLFAKMAAVTDRVFVETICLDYDNANIVFLKEHTGTNETSITGSACKPSPRWVMQQLRRAGFTQIEDISDGAGNRAPTAILPGLLYDWDYENTCGWRRNDCTLRRMFLASKAGPDDPLLRWDRTPPWKVRAG